MSRLVTCKPIVEEGQAVLLSKGRGWGRVVGVSHPHVGVELLGGVRWVHEADVLAVEVGKGIPGGSQRGDRLALAPGSSS